MEHFLRHFKLALIVTAVAFVLMIVTGLIGVTWIVQSRGPNKNERAAMLGQGLAVLTGVIVTPFWIYGAYQSGKERRKTLKKASAKSKSTNPRRKPRG